MTPPTTQADIVGALLSVGYVTTAPACGDCAHSAPEPQGMFCQRHLVLVDENGRCKQWEPADHWLRANPLVAPHYTASVAAPDATRDACGLSPAELAYTHQNHTLQRVGACGDATHAGPWPFPNAS